MAAILLRHQYIQVCLKVACSAGVFWVGETLLCSYCFVAAIFDFMMEEDWGE